MSSSFFSSTTYCRLGIKIKAGKILLLYFTDFACMCFSVSAHRILITCYFHVLASASGSLKVCDFFQGEHWLPAEVVPKSQFLSDRLFFIISASPPHSVTTSMFLPCTTLSQFRSFMNFSQTQRRNDWVWMSTVVPLFACTSWMNMIWNYHFLQNSHNVTNDFLLNVQSNRLASALETSGKNEKGNGRIWFNLAIIICKICSNDEMRSYWTKYSDWRAWNAVTVIFDEANNSYNTILPYVQTIQLILYEEHGIQCMRVNWKCFAQVISGAPSVWFLATL